jgi:hypothetical protein
LRPEKELPEWCSCIFHQKTILSLSVHFFLSLPLIFPFLRVCMWMCVQQLCSPFGCSEDISY